MFVLAFAGWVAAFPVVYIEGGTPEDLPRGSSAENVNFRTPIQRQPPRQLRFGIRYGF